MKVFHLSHSDISGGAARAALRIHHALRNSGCDSQMLVNQFLSGDWTINGPRSKWVKYANLLRPRLTSPLRSLLKSEKPTLLSPAVFSSGWPDFINNSDVDLVNLHWVQGEMLSIKDIVRIRKPIVWTLHDMWAFCGAEHYTTDTRWKQGYNRDNRPSYESGFDLNRYSWLRKKKFWTSPLHIVCPSTWLSHCVKSSALMKDWPVFTIPNPINTKRWQPLDQSIARDLLELPQHCPLLLFGAIGGGKDPRKGVDLLFDALFHLYSHTKLESLQLVVFGEPSPQSPPNLGFPIHYLGHLSDDLSLRAAYSAADVMVIPSRQDNLPNTGLEAHACGTPVVAFDTGGMRDIVIDGTTGALAKPFDPVSLANSIAWLFDCPTRLRSCGLEAVNRATSLWNPSRVSALYNNVYKTAILNCHTQSQ